MLNRIQASKQTLQPNYLEYKTKDKRRKSTVEAKLNKTTLQSRFDKIEAKFDVTDIIESSRSSNSITYIDNI